QLARDGAEDARPAGVPLLVHEHDRVAVEAHVGAVGPARVVARPDDHPADDGARLDLRRRERLLDARDDDVADGRVPAVAAPEHLDGAGELGAGVVGDVEPGPHLDHDDTSEPPSPASWRPAGAAGLGASASRGLGPATSATSSWP